VIQALDSWAVLALISGEPCDAARIESALDSEAVMSWVNAVEVAYSVTRGFGSSEGEAVLSSLQARVKLILPDEVVMKRVIALKARHSIALGDCFAVATAAQKGAELLTGDPETLAARGIPCQVVDVRAGLL